jgi:hypothetical protein
LSDGMSGVAFRDSTSGDKGRPRSGKLFSV